MGADFLAETEELSYGDVTDLSNFGGALIDRAAYDKNVAAIERARGTAGVEIAVGGKYDDSEGYFVRPTVLLADDPGDESFAAEYFGPVLSVHVYDDGGPGAFEQLLEVVDASAPYALTGSVIADDRVAVDTASAALRFTAGNFYVNDKPTGAVVGQQPFGGSRASGTNDKAGSPINLLRWTSARTVKETFVPPTDYRYPHMGPEA
jgi:1-pyrroline-5-carboxylate dehydrogenase